MVTTLLIFLGSIALLIWIIVYSANSGLRKQRRQLEQQLAQTAASQQLQWDLKDVEPRRAFAWSQAPGILFFMDFSATGQQQLHLFHKSQIESCKLVEHSATTRAHKGQAPERSITRIELNIIANDRTSVTLTIYNELIDGIFERVKLAEKAQKIKALLSSTVTESTPQLKQPI